MNMVKTDAGVAYVWFTTLRHERIDDSMYTPPSVGELESYGNDAKVMMMIAGKEIEGLLVKGADRMYAERTQVESQTQSVENLIGMLQVNRGTRNKIKTSYATLGFWKSFDWANQWPGCRRHLWKCLKRWYKLDKFINAIKKWISFCPLFFWPVAELIKTHVHSTIYDICFTQLYAQKRRW